MSVQFSPVINAQPRRIPAFSALQYIDLVALGVYGSPLAVLDDFRVQELPFSAHPHAGFAAVTYVFEDSASGVRSRTSTGADLVVGAGGIVWTQAGSGVIHEEVPAERGRELHGLQLFVNLSSKNKLSARGSSRLRPMMCRTGAATPVTGCEWSSGASTACPPRSCPMSPSRCST